jgi:ankyrin repeat protein
VAAFRRGLDVEALRQSAEGGKPVLFDQGLANAMLHRGFPVAALSQHGGSPLHRSAFHGNPDMMESVLRHNPPIDAQDRQFLDTAMGWLIHGALNPWGFSTGRHDECAHLLLAAGVA